MQTTFAPYDHRFVVTADKLDTFIAIADPFVVDVLNDEDGHHGVAIYCFGRHDPKWHALRALDCRSRIPADLARSLLS